MVSSTIHAISAASLLFSLPVSAGLYPKSSAVLSINGKSYEQLIAKSNHTSIVEFYAPWCGHCKNLQPAYEKAAINLKGLANVAAVDCDEESNKAFCGSMGVQGFPTLKIVRPGKKAGRPVVEDYQGARAAKAIVDAVVEKITNHVEKITDKGLEDWLKQGNETAKAVLFTDKGTTSALLRALAIDYLGNVPFAQVRNKEKSAAATFGITKFPTFLVLPGGEKEAVVYNGDLKKDAMRSFVKEASGIDPNPVAAAPEPKKKKPEKKKEKESKKSAPPKPKAASGTVESDGLPTESPDPKVDTPPPVRVDKGSPMVLMLEKEEDLQRECFTPKSHICILALLPTKDDKEALLPKEATQALISLGEVQQKHSKRHSLFPFYSVPVENPLGKVIREALDLQPMNEIKVIAVNAKRLWWRQLSSTGFLPREVEDWVDTIRMNDGPRSKLPDTLIREAPPAAEPEPKPAKEAEPPKEEQVPKPSSCPHGHDKKKSPAKPKADESSQAPLKPKKVIKQDGLDIEFLDDDAPEPEPVKASHEEL